MLPVTLAYLGKYDKTATAVTVSAKCLLFGAGIAVVYTTLGVSAAAFGTVFGSYVSAPIFGLLSGLLYVAMGLSLMGLPSVKLPSIDLPGGVPGSNSFAGAFTLGASSALLEAPCTSPILGALLTYLAASSSSDTSSAGAGFSAVDATLRAAATMALFSIGYATPLVTAGALGGKVISAVFTSRSAAAAEVGVDVLSAALVAWGTYLFLVAGERVLDV
jgi:thiol:disulfide interchange protein DsbD